MVVLRGKFLLVCRCDRFAAPVSLVACRASVVPRNPPHRGKSDALPNVLRPPGRGVRDDVCHQLGSSRFNQLAHIEVHPVQVIRQVGYAKFAGHVLVAPGSTHDLVRVPLICDQSASPIANCSYHDAKSSWTMSTSTSDDFKISIPFFRFFVPSFLCSSTPIVCAGGGWRPEPPPPLLHLFRLSFPLIAGHFSHIGSPHPRCCARNVPSTSCRLLRSS